MSIALTLSYPSRLSAAASASATDASSGGPFAWLEDLMGQVPELAQPGDLGAGGRDPVLRAGGGSRARSAERGEPCRGIVGCDPRQRVVRGCGGAARVAGAVRGRGQAKEARGGWDTGWQVGCDGR